MYKLIEFINMSLLKFINEYELMLYLNYYNKCLFKLLNQKKKNLENI